MTDTGSFKAIARARARSLTQWPLLIVLGIVLAGLCVVMLGPWRVGTALIGGALGLGAVERAVLPRDVVGLLQVRNKPFDVSFLVVTGVAVIVLALAVPPP